MELKFILELYLRSRLFLLIAPLMELKSIIHLTQNTLHLDTFNRTAYGIEIPMYCVFR